MEVGTGKEMRRVGREASVELYSRERSRIGEEVCEKQREMKVKERQVVKAHVVERMVKWVRVKRREEEAGGGGSGSSCRGVLNHVQEKKREAQVSR